MSAFEKKLQKNKLAKSFIYIYIKTTVPLRLAYFSHCSQIERYFTIVARSAEGQNKF